MAASEHATVRALLLTRRGLAFVSSVSEESNAGSDAHVRALELELAQTGYVVSSRLRARLLRCSLDELTSFRAWALAVLLAHVGGDRKHEPLFRRFPDGIPSDTRQLWWTKVLVHYLQSETQPCLFCGRQNTTHVLNPCEHVVCEHCFDGSSYSACPVCEHHVDRSSPFFRAPPVRLSAHEWVVFKRIDLGGDFEEEARALFVSLAERRQALSPADRDALQTILQEHRQHVLSWIPDRVPLRENIAFIFGTLLRICDPVDVLPHAKRYMTTATDVLRLIAVLSGKDGSLVPEMILVKEERVVQTPDEVKGFFARLTNILGASAQHLPHTVLRTVHRFKVAKLPRALRRTLLAVLEGLHPDRLVEDMLRHRSYWVWVGEFLHPHEYARRFPNVARAFQIVRKKGPDGVPAPGFEGWSAKLERLLAAGDLDTALETVTRRPGELARRLDHMLRLAPDDGARSRVIESFAGVVPAMATPVLLTLRAHLGTREHRAPVRVYWPKNRVGKGVVAPDERPILPQEAIEALTRVLDAELLQRFAQKPAFAEGIVDASLASIVVPFTERSASRSAVTLPRGSRVPVAQKEWIRLFLHWCQPANGYTTDLDLSVAFYDERWQYRDVCSYYQLRTPSSGDPIAQSAGDLRDAPWPDGASEFVDIHRDRALASGIRYAVMVVNAYAGMPFARLERAFAGCMLRDDPGGAHFDPATVELKFALDGEHGVFLPLVLDVREGTIHWLDVYSKGQFAMNNVETSSAAITTLCPALMQYFESGARPSMLDLALLHAAARCERVVIRGETSALFVRRPGESPQRFHERLRRGEADEPRSQPVDGGTPILALLLRGHLDLPEASSTYALFRERVVSTLAASDLLS